MNEELPKGMDQALRALDARWQERAGTVDVERVADRVVARLRREGLSEPRRLAWLTPRALRIAAAVVVVVAGGATARLALFRPMPAALPLPQVQASVDSLNTGQLEAAVKAAAEVRPTAEAVPVSSRSYDDLSEKQLQTLLASLGGGEG